MLMPERHERSGKSEVSITHKIAIRRKGFPFAPYFAAGPDMPGRKSSLYIRIWGVRFVSLGRQTALRALTSVGYVQLVEL